MYISYMFFMSILCVNSMNITHNDDNKQHVDSIHVA